MGFTPEKMDAKYLRDAQKRHNTAMPSRETYVADSEARTLTKVPEEVTNLNTTLRRARKYARTILAAKAAKKRAEADIDKVRDNLIADAEALGLSEIEVDGGKVQIVKPVSVKIVGEDELIKSLERHRPEFLDSVAPAKRTVNRENLIAFIESGSLPKSWRKHVAHVEGTTQLR